MCKYGSPSPKRTVLWGNSKGVKRFRTDKLTKKDLERLPVRLARKSGDGRGYTGNKTALKQSQHLACKGFFKSCTAPDAHAAFQHVRSYPSGFGAKYARIFKKLQAAITTPHHRKAMIQGICMSFGPKHQSLALSQDPGQLEPAEIRAGMLEDMWADAEMHEVLTYLQTNRRCNLPSEWAFTF